MPQRPTVALALVPGLTEQLFSDASRARLAALCEVLDEKPLTNFASDRAARLLPQTEILLTSWGCAADRRGGARPRTAAARRSSTPPARSRCTSTRRCWERGMRGDLGRGGERGAGRRVHAGGDPARQQARLPPAAALPRACARLRLWAQRGARARQLPAHGRHRRRVAHRPARARAAAAVRLRACWSPIPTSTAADGAALGARARRHSTTLLAASDVVSLHAPALPETHHLLDARRLALLRDGATLINTARGCAGGRRGARARAGRAGASTPCSTPPSPRCCPPTRRSTTCPTSS